MVIGRYELAMIVAAGEDARRTAAGRRRYRSDVLQWMLYREFSF
jgi:hypothetical protein